MESARLVEVVRGGGRAAEAVEVVSEVSWPSLFVGGLMEKESEE